MNEIINDVLLSLGMPTTITNRQQCEAMLEGLRLFGERNDQHRDLWVEGGVEDAAHHCRSKALRLLAGAQRGDYDQAAMLDDARDLQNYSTFAVRHLTARLPIVLG